MQKIIAFSEQRWYDVEYDKGKGVCRYEDTGCVDRWV